MVENAEGERCQVTSKVDKDIAWMLAHGGLVCIGCAYWFHLHADLIAGIPGTETHDALFIPTEACHEQT